MQHLYVFGDDPAPVQRVDVRIVHRDGDDPRLYGRLTAEGIPPSRQPRVSLGRFYAPNGGRVADEVLALLADAHPAVREPTTLPTECFADALPALGAHDEYDLGCVDGASPDCVAACRGGSAASCLHAAWALDQAWWHDPFELYRLACVGGEASGCTNLAAMWIDRAPEGDALAVSCGLALFERACAAHDAYACGMVGHTLVREAHGDPAAARAQLEAGCRDTGYFACEVLAGMLANGDLGPHDDADVLRAREHACDDGYAPSCAQLPVPRTAPPPRVPEPEAEPAEMEIRRRH
jgi:hypothetical protein